MKKQDKQGVRTAADLERKYNLGEVRKTFNDMRQNSYLSTENLNKMSEQIRADVNTQLQNYAKKDDLSNFATKSDISDFLPEMEVDRIAEHYGLEAMDYTERKFNALSKTVDELDGKVHGSWIALTLGDGFIARGNSDNLKPVYKATGCVITVCGVVSNTAAMTIPAEGVVIAKGIATEHRPHMDHHFVCQTANMDLWRCAVKTDGTVTLARLGNTTARDLGANTWLPFTVTYQI